MPAGGPLRRTLSLGKAPTGRKLRDTTAGAITSTEKATTDADASAMFGVVVWCCCCCSRFAAYFEGRAAVEAERVAAAKEWQR